MWLFKVRSVATLWAQACYGASSKRSHTLAAAAIDALHTALVDPEDCKHLLLITYNVTSPMLIQGGLHAVINSLQAYPPAQMTAGACLARLCTEEVKRADTGAADKTQWLSKALQEGTFQLVYDSLQESVQVPMPWTTEHCAALARCMSRMAQLQDTLPHLLQFKQVSTL